MRKIKNIFLIVIACICLSACARNNEVNPVAQPTLSVSPPVSSITPKDLPNVPSFNIMEKKEIFFYTVNAVSFETEAISAIVEPDTELTPEFILNYVVDAMEEEDFFIEIDRIVTEDRNIIVSFQSGTEPSTGLAEEAEKAVLDAIAQSLLDNLLDYDSVIFRIMDEAYMSDNFSFSSNYIYMED